MGQSQAKDREPKKHATPPQRSVFQLPLMIVVVGLLFAIALWDTSKRQKESWVEENARKTAEDFERRVSSALDQSLAAFRQAARFAAHAGLADRASFEGFAQDVFAGEPGTVAMVLTRKPAEPLWVRARSGSEAQTAEVTAWFKKAFSGKLLDARRRSRRSLGVEGNQAHEVLDRVWTSQTARLGDKQVIGLAAQRGPGGVFAAVLDIGIVLTKEFRGEGNAYYYMLTGEQSVLFGNVPEKLPWEERPLWRVGRTISFAEHTWLLEVWPTRAQLKSMTYLDMAALLILGSWSLFSISAAFLAWTIVSRSQVLEREVLKRTAELSVKNKELEDKNQEIENFIYSISHDLKSPIVSIQGFASILAEELKDKMDEGTRMYLDRITANTNQMHALIHDLLEFSRVGRLDDKPEVVNIQELVKNVVEEHQPQLDEKKIGVDLTGEFPTVSVPVNRVRQVIDNLVSNAIKYMGTPEQPAIQVSAKPLDGQYEICVKDNGLGIPKEFHEKVFVIFQRVHTDIGVEGTGIGLATVKKIVDHMGGKIWVESEPGKGSAFHFTLPAKKAA